MANCIKLASDALYTLILEGLGRLVADQKLPAEPIPAFKIEIPADKSHGDFAANVAMVSAKVFRKAPRQIAQLLAEELHLEGSLFDRVEIAGPGFLNFFLRRSWFSDVLRCVRKEQGA